MASARYFEFKASKNYCCEMAIRWLPWKDRYINNRPFSYSEKECESNDISLQFVEFSNVHNCDRSSNAIQSKLAHKNV